MTIGVDTMGDGWGVGVLEFSLHSAGTFCS
jgi:hypothetical protein